MCDKHEIRTGPCGDCAEPIKNGVKPGPEGHLTAAQRRCAARFNRVDWPAFAHREQYGLQDDVLVMSGRFNIRETAERLGRTVQAIKARRYFLTH